MAGGASPQKAILYALAANSGIAVAKTAAAMATGSTSMVAEAIHSYADSGNQLLLLLGLHRSKRPPDREHPLGYGKVTYFWSFVVALLLFSIGGLFSLYEGWHKLHGAEPIQSLWIAVLVLLFSMALEVVSLRGCLAEVARERGGRSLWRWVNESRSAELVVVFGEDLAALLGLSAALVFVVLAALTGNPVWDAAGSMVIGGLLVMIALFVAVRIKALLIGRSADPGIVAAIEREIQADPAILELLNALTVQVGPQLMLAAKLRMSPDLSIDEACEAINNLEMHLKQSIPEIGWCFMEPDLRD
ncbi:MAG: cation diffusion facilitator family transporter [Deltaproteobacteria bacterium]|nr:cation diffusion facilitator family transporter [Deltaproteobacteria bacterium]MBW2445832.1 cation diffusion facilitator family transporter [Deltaproteobacteria bacterium]